MAIEIVDFPMKHGDFSRNPGYPAIEIVDLPWIYPLTLKNGGSFHSKRLPEGNPKDRFFFWISGVLFSRQE